MQFIRQNVFLVVLVGITVVLVAIAVGVAVTTQGSTAQKYIDPLTQTYSSLENLKKNPQLKQIVAVNKQLEAQRTELEGISFEDFARAGEKDLAKLSDAERAALRAEYEKQGKNGLVASVGNMLRDWNRRSCPITKLTVDGKEMDAFPIDQRYKLQPQLHYSLTESFIAEVNKMKQDLGPVVLVSKEDFEQRVAVEKQRLKKEIETQRLQKENEAKAKGVPVATPAPAMGGAPGDYGMAAGNPNFGGGMGVGMGMGPVDPANPDLDLKAKDNVMKALKVEQALKGRVFISNDAFDLIHKTPHVSPKTEDLWWQQVKNWVQGQVVQAIVKTNAMVPADKASALNVPIKHLKSVLVNNKYSMQGKRGDTTTFEPGMGGPPMGPDGYGPAMGPEGPRGYDPMMGGMGGMGGMPAAAPVTGGPRMLKDVGMTQRGSTKDYDVVQYSFTVIMPLRYLWALEQNLMAQNLNTVLQVSWVQPTVDQTQIVPCYYGVEPVLEITINCELLLLTSWERGTYDQDTKTWTLPALMPLEVLGTLRDVARPEDQTRLTELPAAPVR